MKEQHISTKFTVFENQNELSSTERKFLQQAIEARDKAYAPYSSFNVGAAVVLASEEVFVGNNQENAAYPSGVCAERVAIWSAIATIPNGIIKQIYISARSDKTSVDRPIAPCGACRQAIAEYETRQKEPIEIYFTGETGRIVKAHSMNDLLPWMFDNSMLS
ncbi:cytidine deaminase [Lutimonas sp.]|uniref:cytidine deaminase n=1 Tax=Lutimonas sp. TaxID=1872403 RepID=UPI003D9B9AE6